MKIALISARIKGLKTYWGEYILGCLRGKFVTSEAHRTCVFDWNRVGRMKYKVLADKTHFRSDSIFDGETTCGMLKH